MNGINMNKESFGTSKDGRAVFVYTLENKAGMKVRVTDYGAALVSIVVPDRAGTMRDILLGFDNVTGYENHTAYFGAVVGRNANRIADARVTIQGTVYQLDQNDHENNLHSGSNGIDKKIWQVKDYTQQTITLTCTSADLEQGFPGNMEIAVTYNLTDDNALEIHYKAVSDQDTVANFTNHAYFNLGGHDSGNILNQELSIHASCFTPVKDAKAIPTGKIVSVEKTPMDFRKAKKIGRDINCGDTQLAYGGGYDHNYVLDKTEEGMYVCMAEAYSDDTGIAMRAYTDRPCVQLYTGNFIGRQNGKQGAVYDDRHGFCLEAQVTPNAPALLKAGEAYAARTSYQFYLK